jgi:hypothetical protein
MSAVPQRLAQLRLVHGDAMEDLEGVQTLVEVEFVAAQDRQSFGGGVLEEGGIGGGADGIERPLRARQQGVGNRRAGIPPSSPACS